MKAAGRSAKTNALMTVPKLPLTRVTPSVIAMVAPKAAPEDIPVVYGSARGFFIMLCMAAPATPSDIPAIIPAIILGRRISKTTQSVISSNLLGSKK